MVISVFRQYFWFELVLGCFFAAAINHDGFGVENDLLDVNFGFILELIFLFVTSVLLGG